MVRERERCCSTVLVENRHRTVGSNHGECVPNDKQVKSLCFNPSQKVFASTCLPHTPLHLSKQIPTTGACILSSVPPPVLAADLSTSALLVIDALSCRGSYTHRTDPSMSPYN